jgi:hypothetical protein
VRLRAAQERAAKKEALLNAREKKASELRERLAARKQRKLDTLLRRANAKLAHGIRRQEKQRARAARTGGPLAVVTESGFRIVLPALQVETHTAARVVTASARPAFRTVGLRLRGAGVVKLHRPPRPEAVRVNLRGCGCLTLYGSA